MCCQQSEEFELFLRWSAKLRERSRAASKSQKRAPDQLGDQTQGGKDARLTHSRWLAEPELDAWCPRAQARAVITAVGPSDPNRTGSHSSLGPYPRTMKGGLHWDVDQGAPGAQVTTPRPVVRRVGCFGVNWGRAPQIDPGLGQSGDRAETGQPTAGLRPRTPGFGAPCREGAGLCCGRGSGYPGS